MSDYRVQETIRGFRAQLLVTKTRRKFFKKLKFKEWESLDEHGQPTYHGKHNIFVQYYKTLGHAFEAVEKFKRFEKNTIFYKPFSTDKITNWSEEC